MHLFPLFNAHTDLAHAMWKKSLCKGDIAIDATCGAGKDSTVIAALLQAAGGGTLQMMDIQQSAIDKSREALKSVETPSVTLSFHLGCHTHFPDITPKLIVYNLGYLPGGDKSLTTTAVNTLQSVKRATEILSNQGVISIICYPGHNPGAIEEIALSEFLEKLPPDRWSVSYTQWKNRKKSPSLFLIQKNL